MVRKLQPMALRELLMWYIVAKYRRLIVDSRSACTGQRELGDDSSSIGESPMAMYHSKSF